MEIMEAIRSRRSVRRYRSDPVPREKLMQVLEAFRLAPSWKDRQCWRVVVLSDRDRIRQLGELLRYNPGREVFDTVPYFLVVTADPEKSGVRDGRPYYMTDIGIALQNAVLAATGLGLGTCWIGSFTEDPIREFLGVPDHIHIAALTPLGVPDESPDPRPRMTMAELVWENAWETPLTTE